MRHLGSLVLSIVLAPIIWALTGYGIGEVSRHVAVFGGEFTFRLAGGIIALVGAALMLAVLLLLRLSPVGPLVVGLTYIGVSFWALSDLASFSDALNYEVFGQGAATLNPATGIGLIVGVLLVLTALSPRRWRRHDRPAALYAGAPGYTGAPYPGAGPAGYQPAHASPYPTSPGSPAFPAAPGSPAAPYPQAGAASPYQPAAPFQPPAQQAGAPYPPPGQQPPGPQQQPANPYAPPPPAGGAPSWSPPGPSTPPPPGPTSGPPAPTPYPPRQADPTAAPGTSDATTRLSPTPAPTPTRPGDEATTVLPTGEEATEAVDDGGATAPLHGTPPPPAAYPPPGHATPTPPPTDPDATRRF